MKTDQEKLKILGTRIRELRQKAGYSQENFAYEVGFGRGYYGGIERGEHNVSTLNLIKIAKKLKVKVGDLFPSDIMSG